MSVYRLSLDLKTPGGRDNLVQVLRWLFSRPITMGKFLHFVRFDLLWCVRDTFGL